MPRLNNPSKLLAFAIFSLGLFSLLNSKTDYAAAQAGAKKTAPTVTAPPENDNDLSMEVNALRTLYLLSGSDTELAVGTQNPEQRLRTIKNNFANCAQKDKKREKAQISDAYRKALIDLRAAFISEQEDRIDDLDKKLQALKREEDPDLDDAVEITDEARQKAGNFVRIHCSADQVVSYLASYGKDLPNPRTLLFQTMRVNTTGPKTSKPNPQEWKEIRAFVIKEVTWQISGLNIDKGDRVGTHVGELLDKAYAMSDDDLKAHAQELRGEARAIADRVGPTDLLKHIMEQDVAELLSNPRLIPAVEARMKFSPPKK
jgi:hypothetical protein